jgi:hypothetical protein
VSTEYEIVKYRSDCKTQVAELQKLLWSSDASLNTRYLEWKYERNPRLREPLIYLALHRGRPIGMRGFHEAWLEAGTPSRAFPVLVAGDALVAPAHRDRGLVTRIMKAAYADLSRRDYGHLVSLGGASRVNAFGMMTLGWKSAGGLRPMGRIAPTATRRRRLTELVGGLPLVWRFKDARVLAGADQRAPFRHLDAVDPGRRPGGHLPIAVERGPRLDAMIELVERLGHDGRIRYVRDREYLAWRYQNPLSEYRFLYWAEARLEGYLVLARRASDLGDWSRVYIADLESTDMRVRADLLSAAIQWGRFPEFVTWTATLSAEELQLLKDRAFAPVDPENTARGCPCILVRPLRDGLSETRWSLGDRRVLDASSWDVRVLYSMRG